MGTPGTATRRPRAGSIRAYAIIDRDDIEEVSRWSWHLGSDGYAMRATRENRRTVVYCLHRALLGLTTYDRVDVDHVNRERLDCRRANLRVVPKGANDQNKTSYKGSSSRFRGVTWSRTARKWVAQVMTKRKNHNLGYFDSEEEAAEAARQGRARLLPYSVD
jgi:hypothetical protein